MLFIGSIVLRVDDLDRQTAFWAAAFDYAPSSEESGAPGADPGHGAKSAANPVPETEALERQRRSE